MIRQTKTLSNNEKKTPKTPGVIIPLPTEKDFSHLKDIRISKLQLNTLLLIAKGYTYIQVADSEDVSEKAVRTRIERLHKTLEAHSSITAFYKALKSGHICIA